MKIKITFLFFLYTIYCFAQNSSFKYYGINIPSIKQEKLSEVKLMSEIHPDYPQAYYNKLIDYVSVKILTTCKGNNRISESNSDTLSAEQKNNLIAADNGSNIGIEIKFKYKDTANDIYGGGGRIKEMNLMVAIVSEVEADYPGGFNSLTEYLQEKIDKKINSADSLSLIPKAVVSFCINENGEIIQPKIERSSQNQDFDHLLLEAFSQMPKWQPAKNAKGENIQQTFVLNYPFGKGGC